MGSDLRGGAGAAQDTYSAVAACITSDVTRAGPRIKVLLVSDLSMIRQALRLLLEANGCTILAEVALCEDATEATGADAPDILLVDVDSGRATLACLDQLATTYPGRIIALVHPALVADHANLVEHGASGIVLKNQSADVLLKAITKVHAGEAWLGRATTATLLRRISRRGREEHSEGEKIAKLTARERDIITLIGDGLKNAAIGERLFISEATVRNHLTSILDKLGLSDRFELAVYAFRHGLVECRQTSSPSASLAPSRNSRARAT
jgi:two-component system, NarL family, nitrate/nitrite response regulator NarL